MQGFLPPSSPALGNPATQAVPSVPGLAMSGGVAPSLTQSPAAPVGSYPPPGFAQPHQPQATYPAYFRVPGPTALGPTPDQAPLGTGGVAGVSMAPVGTVAPPAGPGGPHPLPPLPQVPLPQGFPNPFSVQAVGQGPAPGAGAPAPQQPGMTSVTGPMGYMPGLGYFAPPGADSGFGQAAPPGQGSAPPPTAFPVLPGGIQGAAFHFPQGAPQSAPQAPPPAPPRAQGQPGPPPNPFWLQLAWQLVQTPAVRQVLGDSAQLLLESEDRMRALQIAAGCLTGQELQAAFKALTSGQLEQTRFTELFANQVRHAFHATGLLR